jgi:hypothetical protein
MRVCALSLFDVDLQTHMNGNSVGAGLVHKLVVMSCLLESLVSWYHLLTVVITGVNEGVENRYFLASVLTAKTKTTLLGTSRLLYINRHSTQTPARKLCQRNLNHVEKKQPRDFSSRQVDKGVRVLRQ